MCNLYFLVHNISDICTLLISNRFDWSLWFWGPEFRPCRSFLGGDLRAKFNKYAQLCHQNSWNGEATCHHSLNHLFCIQYLKKIIFPSEMHSLAGILHDRDGNLGCGRVTCTLAYISLAPFLCSLAINSVYYKSSILRSALRNASL